MSTVLDGGNKIILANWSNDKHIICNINNDILVKIPSHPFVLINRSVLCNCGIDSFGIFGSMSRSKFKIGHVLYHECSFCQLPGPVHQYDRIP